MRGFTRGKFNELCTKVARTEARGNARTTRFPRLVSAVGTGIRGRMGDGDTARANHEGVAKVEWLLGVWAVLTLLIVRRWLQVDREVDRLKWELYNEKGKRRDLESRLVRMLQKPR